MMKTIGGCFFLGGGENHLLTITITRSKLLIKLHCLIFWQLGVLMERMLSWDSEDYPSIHSFIHSFIHLVNQSFTKPVLSKTLWEYYDELGSLHSHLVLLAHVSPCTVAGSSTWDISISACVWSLYLPISLLSSTKPSRTPFIIQSHSFPSPTPAILTLCFASHIYFFPLMLWFLHIKSSVCCRAGPRHHFKFVFLYRYVHCA